MKIHLPPKGTLWFTSDQHFNHEKIIRYTKRPFKGADEMNATLIANFNRVVGPEDIVIHCGDLGWFSHDWEIEELFSKLNGARHYVTLGNHDWMDPTETHKYTLTHAPIEVVTQFKKSDLVVLVASHYPFANWNCKHRGSMCVHGHEHNKQQRYSRRGQRIFDVGVDANDFTPVSFEEVYETLRIRSNRQLRTDRLSEVIGDR